MRTVTARDRIREAPEKWRLTYFRNEKWREVTLGVGRTKQSAKAIYDRLGELDTRVASRDDVANIIGNRTWTNIECDECGEDELSEAVIVAVSSEARATLCRPCLQRALGLLSAGTGEGEKR